MSNLDQTFAAKGIFTSNFGSHAIFLDLAVQSDGKIIAVGATDFDGKQPKVLVARFTPSGHLDKTFSGDGFDVSTLAGHGSIAYKVLLLGTGKFLVAGERP